MSEAQGGFFKITL